MPEIGSATSRWTRTAHQLPWRRRGRMERTASVRRRGVVDIAMICLMQDAELRVSEAAALAWGGVEGVGGGSGRVCVGALRRPITAW